MKASSVQMAIANLRDRVRSYERNVYACRRASVYEHENAARMRADAQECENRAVRSDEQVDRDLTEIALTQAAIADLETLLGTAELPAGEQPAQPEEQS